MTAAGGSPTVRRARSVFGGRNTRSALIRSYEPADCTGDRTGLSNVDGDGTYVRVQVLTNAGALDRDKQLAVVSRLTTLVADAAGDSSLADRTWVLLTEAPDGGWGLAGHANTNEELVAAARAQIAELQAKKPND